MEETEEVKKIEEIIRQRKMEIEECEHLEYAEFIDYGELSESEEVDEDYNLPDFPKSDMSKFNRHTSSFLLRDDEKQVIHLCKDPKLKSVLLLNRNKNVQLMQLYKKIKDLLIECQENISMKEEQILSQKVQKRTWNRVWRLGSPYFKTRDDYPCPRNEDTVKKHLNGELLCYEMTPSAKWSNRDMNRLLKGVAFCYKTGREVELQKEITKMEKQKIDGADNMKSLQLEELRTRLNEILDSKVDVYPPLNSETNIDWRRVSESFLSEKYSEQECQTFWRIYLHPDINKAEWTPQENERLKTLAVKYKWQNWDRIARELKGRNRTGFIACIYYYSKLVQPIHKNRFTPSEDKLLCELVDRYKQGDYVPWAMIAHHFKDRTRQQLFYRYKYFLTFRNKTNKGKFSEAEDILILILVDRFGKKFSKCQEYFPSRSLVQIKARYSSNLRNAIKKGAFSVVEDQQILDYTERNGTARWEPLVKEMNRCGAQIRQRYKTLRIFFQQNPNGDLKDAPRRKNPAGLFDAEFAFLRCMADKFKNCNEIPTLQDIEKLLISNPKSKILNDATNIGHNEIPSQLTDAVTAVDELLTEFFNNSMKLRFEQNISRSHIRKAAEEVRGVLSILQVELHVPRNFRVDKRLDHVDVGILNILIADCPITVDNEYVVYRSGLNISRLIPPSLNSVVGMRSLLIKNEIYKSKNMRKHAHIFEDLRAQSNEKQILWCINSHLLNRPEIARNQLISERNMFFKRFVSLFKFPAVMTLEPPSVELQSTSNDWRNYLVAVTRTYNRKPRQELSVWTKSKDDTTFEGFYIKQQQQQQPDEEDFKSLNAAITSENSECNKIIDESSCAHSRQQKCIQGELQCLVPKISVTDLLKKRINETLSELSQLPPSKKYYRDCRLPSSIPTKEQATPSSKKRGKNKTETAVPKTYQRKKDGAAAKKPEPNDTHFSHNFGDSNREAIKHNFNSGDKNNGNFNFGKGELLLENENGFSINADDDDDLQDLNALNVILKKEQCISEESYDLL